MSTPAQTLQGLQRFHQGQRLLEAGNPRAAAMELGAGYRLLPRHPELLLAYAGCCEQLADWSRAATLYEALLLLRPGERTVRRQLARSLFRASRVDDALVQLQELLAQEPADTESLRLLAMLYTGERRWQEALDAARRLYTLVPDTAATDLLLFALYQLGMGDELDPLVEVALQRHGDNLLVMSTCVMHLMKRADGRRGFAFPQAVRLRSAQGLGLHDVPPRWWDGRPFDGVLLVSGKQGVGDEILAATLFRDLDALRAQGQRVLIECDVRLLPLFRRSFPLLAFITAGEETARAQALGESDFRVIKSLDLMHYFRRETPIPPQQPWLLADDVRTSALRTRWQERLPGQRLGGASWKSSRPGVGAHKSMALTDLGALLALPSCTWFNLQYGDIANDLAEATAAGMPLPIVEADIDPTADLDALAAQIGALDIVVTTSNTTAHLAGALGKTCHLLLPRAQGIFWYWGYDGDRTPWYPSIRIHRNTRDDDWRELVARVAGVLAVTA